MVEGTTIDIVLHVVTMLVAVGLVLVSLRAYRKKRSRRFLYVCGAFAVFMLKEALTLVSVTYGLPTPATAIIHALNLVILMLFFYGVMR